MEHEAVFLGMRAAEIYIVCVGFFCVAVAYATGRIISKGEKKKKS